MFMEVPFTKMHGLGNDFVVTKSNHEFTSEVIARICDRHFGIGADGFIIVSPIDQKNVRMQYWNNDGSVAEMCGNGLRCAARFAVENDMIRQAEFTVQTDAGPRDVIWTGSSNEVEVQVGRAVVGKKVTIDKDEYVTVDVGNPHAVSFVDNVVGVELLITGPKIETDSNFPNKTNVEFVEVVSENKLKMIIWERGVGVTLACGTGMVASVAAAYALDKVQLPVTVEVPGGKAKIWLDNDNFYRIKAQAINVYKGEITA